MEQNKKTKTKSKEEPKWLDLTLSEFIGQTLKLGKVPLFRFVESNANTEDVATQPSYNSRKANQTFQIKIDRITGKANAYKKSSLMWKMQFQLLNKFIKQLLSERKITKEELKPYSPKHKDTLK